MSQSSDQSQPGQWVQRDKMIPKVTRSQSIGLSLEYGGVEGPNHGKYAVQAGSSVMELIVYI